MVDDTAERNDLSDEEIEDFLYENYEDKESTEYIVDGAILTCTNCTIEDRYIKNEINPSGTLEAITGYCYYAPIDESINRSEFPNIGKKALGRLTVTENPAAEANSLKYATVTDCVKENNIPYFGNCLRAPDSELEMYTFNAIHKEANQGMEKRKEGSCKYLMKLESEWENYEIGQSFLSFPDDAKGQQSGITMTSMLFCKHGGFIYPVTSGQVKVEEEVEEEIVEEVEVEEVLVLMEPELDDSEAIKEYVWNFFLNKGFSKEVVAGIIGNIQQECNFDLVTAAEINSKRFGLFQWSTDPTDKRKSDFDEWVIRENLDINLVSTQCEYAYREITTGGMLPVILDANENNPSELLCNYDTFIKADTPEEAAKIFAASFERCFTGHRTENGQMHYYDIQESADRQAYARGIYDEKTNE